jgi:hypothetical protein
VALPAPRTASCTANAAAEQSKSTERTWATTLHVVYVGTRFWAAFARATSQLNCGTFHLRHQSLAPRGPTQTKES